MSSWIQYTAGLVASLIVNAAIGGIASFLAIVVIAAATFYSILEPMRPS